MKISVRKTPPPAAMISETAAKKSVYEPVHQAVRELKPGEWFTVPGTAGKIHRQLAGLVGGIQRRARAAGVTGLCCYPAADGSGLVVKLASDGLDEPEAAEDVAAPRAKAMKKG